MAPLWHQHPPQNCIQHPLQHLTTPTTTMTSHHEPPTTHLDPGYAFRPPSHAFPPPTYVFPPPDTGFDYLQPPSSAFWSRLAPQTLKRTYDCSYMCFSFCFFLFGFGNMCTSNHTCVSCVFIYLSFIFTLETHVWLLVHAFLMFLSIYYPQNVCMSNHTCVSLYIHVWK